MFKSEMHQRNIPTVYGVARPLVNKLPNVSISFVSVIMRKTKLGKLFLQIKFVIL